MKRQHTMRERFAPIGLGLALLAQIWAIGLFVVALQRGADGGYVAASGVAVLAVAAAITYGLVRQHRRKS
ncbi:hypothetical protein [Amycolatopsis keratiniphila]|uniref:Uncharacterized protein n=1 Tax=Amycolatopsis keratiniphila subsp. keratiniphila TaxID=227715 RepID=A0A1W2LVU3_9PSEU|nr:hypothetical protein [Amycolatopsis keratiniphila]OLZ58104.1 hypothetical protein BS330_12785 [Amycolatopsis keratiniphila subsp. nogabecina]ONF70437.1 hypothetical protein AVR91_0216595 [Amycolatopsis keratiniphila subsp. keratiniphila]SDU44103.1 hypothetical protein SAMN04489733_4293 [Amycolatopsis keratiniphila]